MKLLVYGTDGSAPIQFNDVAKIERVFPDGSTKTMKVVPAPLQFTHDPTNDWTMIMTDRDGRPVDETLPPGGKKVILTRDDGVVVIGFTQPGNSIWDYIERSNFGLNHFISWKPWPDPAPYPEER